MVKYKIKTENGIKIIDIDKKLDEGDRGFILNGNIAKIKGNAILFRVIDKDGKIEEEDIDKTYEIEELKKEEEKRFVLGRVLVPNRIDLGNDVINKEETEKAAHQFMINEHAPGLIHKAYAKDTYIVENYIAPTDFAVNGEEISAGTWIMGMKILNDEIWEAVKNNELNAYSIGGWAKKVPVE